VPSQALAKLKANNEQLSAELAERVAEVEQLRATVDVDAAIDVKMSGDAKIAALNDQLNAMKRENQGLKDANDQFIKK
jgi:predicted RNase H-like nuclease (RuvC/YqgF family)